MTTDYSAVDDETLAARAKVIEHAEIIFPLLTRSRDGRVELMRHREIACARLRHREPVERQWAAIMIHYIDRFIPPRSRPRRLRRKHH